MMLLLSQLAFAKVAASDMEACSDAYVIATVPSAGATVPYDLSPAIVWADDCGLGGVFELRIEQAEDLVTSHSVVVDAGTRSGVDRIPLESPLSTPPLAMTPTTSACCCFAPRRGTSSLPPPSRARSGSTRPSTWSPRSSA